MDVIKMSETSINVLKRKSMDFKKTIRNKK